MAKADYLPCPFCGKPARVTTRKDESLWSHEIVNWYSVSCSGDCEVEMTECKHQGRLIKRWNTRTASREEAAKEQERNNNNMPTPEDTNAD